MVYFGILPLTFSDPLDYDRINLADQLEIPELAVAIRTGSIRINNLTQASTFTVAVELTERQRAILLAGGLLNYTRKQTTLDMRN